MGTDQTRSSCRPRSDLGEEDEIEEGEFVAGSVTDDDSRYVFQHRRDGVHEEGRPQIKRRRLEGALPSPTPSCEYDSDGTISDMDADDTGAAALAQETFFPCPVCWRRFKSQKAKCGHMRAHGPHGIHKVNKERPLAPAIIGGWGVTGKRGSVGGRSVSPESQGVVDSMAIVVAEPVMDPMPIAFASSASARSNNVEPSPPNDDSMAIVVAVAADKSPSQNQAVVHPTRSPQFVTGHQLAAPQVAVNNPQAAVAQGQQLAEAALPQFVAGLQHAAHQVQHAAPPARDEQGWWLCKEEGCNQRYATHQGLGGHMAGHKNRQMNEAAVAGLYLGIGDAAYGKPAKLHHCKHCPKVFNSGVQLGGHMRKHYEGKVVPKRRGAGARPMVPAGELASALALSLTMPPAAMEVAQAQPAVASVSEVAPVVPAGVVRLFGVNIGPASSAAAAAEEVSSAVSPAVAAAAAAAEEVSSAVPAAEEVSSAVPPVTAAAAAAAEEVSSAAPPAAAAAEDVSSAVTETDQSSAASTNIQEQ